MDNVCVIGGGLSGLTFAHFYKNSEVFEKEEVAGGLARSVYDSGYTFDLGSHIIFSKNKAVLDFMLSLIKENRIKHRRNTKILYHGRYVKYPFENGLGDLPKKEAFECAADYIDAYLKREKGELRAPKNFREWMVYRFGKGITKKYLYPYNKKVWSTPPEKMATFWVEGRVPQPSVRDVLKACMGLSSEGYVHQLFFYYPKKGGYQAIPNALSKLLCDRLKTSSEVKAIKKEDNFIVELNDGNIFEYPQIVSTIPVQDFLRIYNYVPSDVKRAAKRLRFNSAYLVMLGVRKPKINNIHWLYIPDEEILPNRISFPSNYSPYVAPKKHSSILAEITFHSSERIAKEKPERIEKTTVEQLSSLGFFKSEEVSFSSVVRVPYAYVVYDLDYEENIKKVYEFAREEGVHLLGRFSEFKYYNADMCVQRGMELAETLKKKRFR